MAIGFDVSVIIEILIAPCYSTVGGLIEFDMENRKPEVKFVFDTFDTVIKKLSVVASI